MSTSRGYEMSSGPAAGRVVGCAVLPAPPDHSCPGAGEPAHGVGVVAAAGDGLAVDLNPHRRAVGSQCDHTSDGAGARSMPAFRSVVSAPVSFVWEDVFYELKAGLRPGNDTPVTAEPTPSVSKVRRCGTHSDACRPDLHGSGHQVAGRDARQRRGGPARRPGAVERQSYRAWRRSLRRR